MSTLFGILASVFALALIIGLLKPSLFNKGFSGGATLKKLGWTFGVATFVFLIASLVTSPSGASPSSPQEAMNLEVKQSTNGQEFGSSDATQVLTIRNLNSHDWNRCDLTLNDAYHRSLSGISIQSELATTSTDVAHATMVVQLNSFVTGDGTRFDPALQMPVSIAVSCADPYYNSWGGSFN